VNDGVDPLKLRDGVPGIEKSTRVELAGSDGQNDLGGRADGQRARPCGERVSPAVNA
jgi:hypothetical protein